MFTEKKKSTSSFQTGNRSVIGKGTLFTGDLVSEGDIRIDGILDGSLKSSGKVIIGKEGKIKGTVACDFADIEGCFSGKITVNQLLTLKSSSNISGETIIGSLAVEPGATFVNTTCTMKGTVKELNRDERSNQTEKTA